MADGHSCTHSLFCARVLWFFADSFSAVVVIVITIIINMFIVVDVASVVAVVVVVVGVAVAIARSLEYSLTIIICNQNTESNLPYDIMRAEFTAGQASIKLNSSLSVRCTRARAAVARPRTSASKSDNEIVIFPMTTSACYMPITKEQKKKKK